jgi:hypothetical protein
MTVEAHDALIDILRQLVFRAEVARRHHDKHANPPPPAAPVPEAEGFPRESSVGPGLRINGVVTGVETLGFEEPDPYS